MTSPSPLSQPDETDVATCSAPLGLQLDLGSGPTPAEGWLGIDTCLGYRVLTFDLLSGQRWPFPDGSVKKLRSIHFIEHIPQERVPIGTTRVRHVSRSPGREPIESWETIPVSQNAFFWFFDEAYRVAMPGARFELAWPHPWHEHADQDPTHQRRIPASTLHYLSKAGRHALNVTQYPVGCDWHTESVTAIGSEEALAPYATMEEASRHVGVFHEIRAVLFKPEV